jgi:hypothetical protein
LASDSPEEHATGLTILATTDRDEALGPLWKRLTILTSGSGVWRSFISYGTTRPRITASGSLHISAES